MKKLLLLVLVMFAALSSGTGAYAAVYEFKEFASHGFSIDVPDGWFVNEDKFSNKFDLNSPDGAIIIGRMGGSELITFLYTSQEAMFSPTFATAVANSLRGSAPVENGRGDFEFTFIQDGIEIDARTRHIGHLGIVMESRSGFDDILAVLETLL